MNGEKLLIGIDLGTSSVKIGAFSQSGEPRFLVSEPFRGDPLKPEVWWKATCRGLRTMLSALGTSRIMAISVGGQGPTLVGIDPNGQSLGLALPWSDTRAEIYAKEVSNKLKKQVNAGWSYLLRVYWVYREDKHRFDNTYKFMQAWDFLTYRLTGNLAGSELPWSHPWPQADLASMNFPAEKFITILDWGTVLGETDKSIIFDTGLPAGIPVVGGTGDATLSIIGSPGLDLGWAHNEGGSSGGISVLCDQPVQGEGLLSAPFVIPGWWMVGGPTSSGGRTVQWLLHDILGYSGDYRPLIERALSKCSHPAPLMFLPYLDGERAPIWDMSVRGAFLGLSLNHTHEDLISAVIEGVTLGLKDILERVKTAGVKIHAATVYGGQAYNPGWNQLKADVFGIPVHVPLVKESTCLGAAAIAGWGIGIWPDIATAGRSLRIVEYTCVPSDPTAAAWLEKLMSFREIYLRTRDPVPILTEKKGENESEFD